ncbi:MAG: hypothetical protein ACFE0I_03175 [Elainellaceae cyanobacterium]
MNVLLILLWERSNKKPPRLFGMTKQDGYRSYTIDCSLRLVMTVGD